MPLATSWTWRADGTPETTRVLLAGSRAEVRAGRVTFAHDDTLQAIVRSCPSDRGFLHFTEGGGLFWSRDFLGRLESVGLARSDLHYRIVQSNPVVALSSSGRPTLLVSRNGARLLGQGDLELVHFQTPERARAVAAPDRLLETTDGGRTFTTLTVRPSAELDQPTAWLGTNIDVLDQASDGSEGLAPSVTDQVRTAWVRRAVATGAGRVAGGLALADGTWARWIRSGGESKMFVAFRTPDGCVTYHSIPGSCNVQSYGKRLLSTCSPNQFGPPSEPLTLSLLGPGGESPLPSPPRPVRVVTADPKGRWIAALAVANDQAKPPGSPALVLFDGATWKQYPGLDVTPLALTSSFVLVKRNPAGPLAVLPLAAPETTVHELGKDIEESAVTLLEHKLATIRRTAVGMEHKAALVWRDLKSGEEGPAHEIPKEIHRVAFADEQHGMAVDSDGGLRVTENGGRSFTRVPWQGTKPDPREVLRCWAHGCSFAAAAAFTDEPLKTEPAALPDPEVELPAALTPSEHPYDEVFPRVPLPEASSTGTDDRHYRCRPTPPLPIPLPGSEKLGVPQVTDPWHASNLPLAPTLLSVVRKGNALTFSGRDAAGAFRVETPALTGVAAELLPGLRERPGGEAYVAVLRPVLLTRSYAILIQTSTKISGSGPDRAGDTIFFVLEATGRAKVLAKTPPAQGTRAGLLTARLQAIPLPKGAAAVHLRAPGRQELFELDATGSVVARRWFVGPGGRMALGPDGISLVVEDRGSTRVYSRARGSAGRDVPWNTRGGFSECTSASPAGASRETYLVAFDLPSIEIGSHLALLPRAGASLLEIGPAGGCWRSVIVTEPFPIDLRAAGATLRGTFIGPERAHALSCRREGP